MPKHYSFQEMAIVVQFPIIMGISLYPARWEVVPNRWQKIASFLTISYDGNFRVVFNRWRKTKVLLWSFTTNASTR